MGTSNGIGIQSMSALSSYLGCSTIELKERNNFECDNCGAKREWNKECPKCFSKHRPSRISKKEKVKNET